MTGSVWRESLASGAETRMRKQVTVESVTPQGVRVRYGNKINETEFLTGIAKPQFNIIEGQIGSIVYRNIGSASLWFWEDNQHC